MIFQAIPYTPLISQFYYLSYTWAHRIFDTAHCKLQTTQYHIQYTLHNNTTHCIITYILNDAHCIEPCTLHTPHTTIYSLSLSAQSLVQCPVARMHSSIFLLVSLLQLSLSGEVPIQDCGKNSHPALQWNTLPWPAPSYTALPCPTVPCLVQATVEMLDNTVPCPANSPLPP